MTEEESIKLFRLLNEAIEIAEDAGCIALLEAVKFREARLIAMGEKPVKTSALIDCGCDDPVTCEDRDDLCPPLPPRINGSSTES